LGRFNCLVLVMGLLKIFQQNLHIYHRNDSTSLCSIHFIYILVLEDVIGSDVAGRFLLAHPVCDITILDHISTSKFVIYFVVLEGV